MARASQGPHRVGELRPSQLLYTFGVGAIVELPHISVMIMGVDDWEATGAVATVEEPRLLDAVRAELGPQVARLGSPPMPEEAGYRSGPLDPALRTGVPVAPFPRWMRCPACHLLAPLSSGVYKLRTNLFRPDRTQYVHESCRYGYKRPPTVLPARFLVACPQGHLDDFPWVSFVHRGKSCEMPRLEMVELGASGEAIDVQVVCRACDTRRTMAEAFGEAGERVLPSCRGRRPHLRDLQPNGCGEAVRTILLGASNSWFAVHLSALSLPVSTDPLEQFIEENWGKMESVDNPAILGWMRGQGLLGPVAGRSDEAILEAIRARRLGEDDELAAEDLKGPEWRLLSDPAHAIESDDFKLREADVPAGYESVLERVVLVERLREVSALIGFTRIESPRNFGDVTDLPELARAPVSSSPPKFAPAVEVRGEGVFLQFREEGVASWCRRAARYDAHFFEAHRAWRRARGIEDEAAAYPGLRFVLLHSFSHALMRQLALECGYNAASIRERIFAREAEEEDGPMAGILLYTAAPDSEGTLGGLVALGLPEALGRHVEQALEDMRLCGSDPLCAEHDPLRGGVSLHGASCHACLFAPETSCERGNKYLDRAVLVPTVSRSDLAFFGD